MTWFWLHAAWWAPGMWAGWMLGDWHRRLMSFAPGAVRAAGRAYGRLWGDIRRAVTTGRWT